MKQEHESTHPDPRERGVIENQVHWSDAYTKGKSDWLELSWHLARIWGEYASATRLDSNRDRKFNWVVVLKVLLVNFTWSHNRCCLSVVYGFKVEGNECITEARKTLRKHTGAARRCCLHTQLTQAHKKNNEKAATLPCFRAKKVIFPGCRQPVHITVNGALIHCNWSTGKISRHHWSPTCLAVHLSAVYEYHTDQPPLVKILSWIGNRTPKFQAWEGPCLSWGLDIQMAIRWVRFVFCLGLSWTHEVPNQTFITGLSCAPIWLESVALPVRAIKIHFSKRQCKECSPTLKAYFLIHNLKVNEFFLAPQTE